MTSITWGLFANITAHWTMRNLFDGFCWRLLDVAETASSLSLWLASDVDVLVRLDDVGPNWGVDWLRDFADAGKVFTYISADFWSLSFSGRSAVGSWLTIHPGLDAVITFEEVAE